MSQECQLNTWLHVVKTMTMIMKIWVDDIRTPPDDSWDIWAKTSSKVIDILEKCKYLVDTGSPEFIPIYMSLDHDLGGDDTTRPIVLWMCENEFWPDEVVVHSANYVGVEWLEGMIKRYHPSTNPDFTKLM